MKIETDGNARRITMNIDEALALQSDLANSIRSVMRRMNSYTASMPIIAMEGEAAHASVLLVTVTKWPK